MEFQRKCVKIDMEFQRPALVVTVITGSNVVILVAGREL